MVYTYIQHLNYCICFSIIIRTLRLDSPNAAYNCFYSCVSFSLSEQSGVASREKDLCSAIARLKTEDGSNPLSLVFWWPFVIYCVPSLYWIITLHYEKSSNRNFASTNSPIVLASYTERILAVADNSRQREQASSNNKHNNSICWN